ncbi:MAG: hypothetical protein AAF636_19855 [Pseudomonadota bacterium]
MTDVVIFSNDFADDMELLSSSKRGGSVPLTKLEKNIEDFGPAINGVVTKLTAAAKAKGLSTVAIKIGINAKGTVGFLGNGGELGGDASITLTFDVSG